MQEQRAGAGIFLDLLLPSAPAPVFCHYAIPKIKAPGMADMPGESQEEPSVMVIAIRCDDPLTSLAEMSSAPSQVARDVQLRS